MTAIKDLPPSLFADKPDDQEPSSYAYELGYKTGYRQGSKDASKILLTSIRDVFANRVTDAASVREIYKVFDEALEVLEEKP